MKTLLAVIVALTFGSCAPNVYEDLYEVTSVVIKPNEGSIEVCSSARDFVRTDVKMTNDSIFLMEAVGQDNKLVVTQSFDYLSVVDFKEGNNEEGEPFELSLINADSTCVTTYLLYDLNNHYE
jgi:hypothetical protein